MGAQAVHPGELVVEFRGADGVAVRQVDRGDPHGARRGRDDAFQVAGLLVAIVAGQAAAHILERALGQDGDAVIGLLAMRHDVVAERLHIGARKGLVHAFQLLQADHVRIGALHEGREVVQPLLDGVHIPRGYPHRVTLACPSHVLHRIFVLGWQAGTRHHPHGCPRCPNPGSRPSTIIASASGPGSGRSR